MNKVKIVDVQSNRYFIGETTSGATNDIYLTDGKTTIKLEDCLIWEEELFDDEEFYAIVEDCKANAAEMAEQGWSIVS
jgi:hypothetical protein